MQVIKLLQGISNSGKSYYTKEFLAKTRNWKNVNRDSIRHFLSEGHNIWKQGDKIEQLVTDTELFVAENLIKQGFNVICSDMNLNPKTVKLWKDLAHKLGVSFEIEGSFLSTPLEVCINRDMHRENSVGAEVIIRQYEKYIRPLGIKERPYTDFLPVKFNNDKTKPFATIADLDGSLAEFDKFDKTAASYRNPYDASSCGNDVLNEPLKKVLDFYKQNDYAVILVSGREDKYRPQTEAWLSKHNVQYDHLYMRKSGDYRKDYIIKDEIYETLILPTYYVEVVYDDREIVCKWLRLKGLRVFNVAAGNF